MTNFLSCGGRSLAGRRRRYYIGDGTMLRVVSFLLPALAVGLAACSDSGGPGGGKVLKGVQVSFATQRPTAPLLGLIGLTNDTTIQGNDTLIITRAEIVLREVELRRLGVVDCDTTAGDDDACEKFESGPALVDLPLTAGAAQRFALDIPVGTYTEIEFDIHKPDDGDPADSAFILAHPAFADVSIRVRGTFNGRPFEHTTDLNVEQELALTPALVITDATTATNVTIFVDLARWYRTLGGALLDPTTAKKGGANESLVNENIKASFEAFEDNDRDGDDS